MKKTLVVRWAVAALIAAALPLAATAADKTIGKIVRNDPKLDKLIPKDAVIEVLDGGFTWTEGPVWMWDGSDPKDGYLLFSDIPRNSVFKWKQGAGTSLFLSPSGYTGNTYYGLEPGCNGNIRSPQGELVSCEHGDRRVSVLTKNGGKKTLVDNYQGKRLNSPNDGCFKSNGDFYFTDPPYGLPDRENDKRQELGFFGVYRLQFGKDGQNKTTLLTKEMTRPNGICLSPDEKTLYVAQSDPAAAIWKSFPVKDDGTTGEGKLFYDATENVGKFPGLPDGMKADKDGNLFATGPGGVFVFSPDGKLLGRLDTGEKTGNVCWGEDGTVLYICIDHHIGRIKTTTKGAGWK